MSLEYGSEIQKLQSVLDSIKAVNDPTKLKEKIDDLTSQASLPDLWDDAQNAQEITSKLAHAQSELAKLEKLQNKITDLKTLSQMVEEENDPELKKELYSEYSDLEKELSDLEITTLLSGEYDERQAVVTIRSGAGGVDAADFTQMLLRMYISCLLYTSPSPRD